MSKTVIVCNGDEPCNLFPTFIIGSAAVAMGDEVVTFFTPNAATALVKGRLETIRAKGLPDMADLVSGFEELGGRMLVCDLCLEAKDLRPEEFRDGVEIVGVVAFLADARNASLSFCF
jgi:predicted peroxiredoxin